jgi:hypothetical protein
MITSLFRVSTSYCVYKAVSGSRRGWILTETLLSTKSCGKTAKGTRISSWSRSSSTLNGKYLFGQSLSRRNYF